MPAMFKNVDDEYFTYQESKEVKEKGGKYVIYDGHGNVLGAHPIETIVEFTTDPFKVKQAE